MKNKTRRQCWILCGVMLVFCALLCLLPDPYLNVTSAFPGARLFAPGCRWDGASLAP